MEKRSSFVSMLAGTDAEEEVCPVHGSGGEKQGRGNMVNRIFILRLASGNVNYKTN
jgi:hypothetical protein